MTNKPEVRLRRVYDEPTDQDGIRILVDRVWPRGLSKERARIDEWCRQVAPSAELRTWLTMVRPRSGPVRGVHPPLPGRVPLENRVRVVDLQLQVARRYWLIRPLRIGCRWMERRSAKSVIGLATVVSTLGGR
jgi:hypothetical protein